MNFLRALRFFVVDFHSFLGVANCDLNGSADKLDFVHSEIGAYLDFVHYVMQALAPASHNGQSRDKQSAFKTD